MHSNSVIDLTIVIPVIANDIMLSKCLLSIAKQQIQPQHVILINNRAYPINDDVILPIQNYTRIINADANLGFGRAVNLGIKIASTTFILVLNDDTELDENCLKNVLAATKSYPDYGSYALMVRSMTDPTIIDSAGLMFSDRGYGNRSNRHLFSQVENPMEVFSACGAAALYRNSILSRLGTFNEEFYFLYEDLELGFRLQLYGCKCLFIPTAIVYHFGGFSSKEQARLRIREGVKNSLLTLLTCMPSKLLVCYACRIMAFYTKLYWSLVLEGYIVDLLTGLIGVATKLFYVISRRNSIHCDIKYDINYINSLLYRGQITINLPKKQLKFD